VITRGENGLIGVTANEIIEVPGVRVDVVDSVGAGDTVGAVIVEALVAYGVNDLRGESLRSTLVRAAKAAAITCSRAGCQPPTAAELRN
jgi:fructokinase